MNGSSGSGGFLVILLLVGFVAAMLVWRWLARKASSGINRAIHQGQHQAGQAAAGTQHFLKAGSLSPQGVLDAIYLGLPYEQAREGSGVLNASIFKDGGTGVPRRVIQNSV